MNDFSGKDRKHFNIEVKVWEEDQNLDTLAQKILNEVTMEGLEWNASYLIKDIAFGMKKLSLTGFYKKNGSIKLEDIIEQINSYKDEVQSVDVIEVIKI